VKLRRPRNPARVAIVVAALLVVVNLAIWGAIAQEDGPATSARPSEIVVLFPEENQRMLPQDAVGADLLSDFTGQVTIDGTLIPLDETTGDPGLGIVRFEPGEGKSFDEFDPGTHNALIEWWPRTIATPEEAREQNELRSYSWAFSVG
jgi:hypothetical protein